MLLRKLNIVWISCLLVTVLNACGSQVKKPSSSTNSVETTTITTNAEHSYHLVSEQNKNLNVLFYDEMDNILSSQTSEFPVGARKAYLSLADKNNKIVRVEYRTCCDKTKPVELKELDNSIYLLKKFELKNEGFRMIFHFQDSDRATLQVGS